MISTIIIIGGGQAGVQAVDTLRREGFAGRLILIGAEHELPYQRPPLSKKFLSGEIPLDRLLLRHPAFFDEHRTELILGVGAAQLDPAARSVLLRDGRRLHYDRLLLCTGASARRLTCAGAELAGVHHLRDADDAAAIHRVIAPKARAVIIGGGYIGLETAATCRSMGCDVVVLEMTDRVLNRVAAPAVSEFFTREHEARGVLVVCNARVESLRGRGRVESVSLAGGASYPADFIIVGIGAVPNIALAQAAGLTCDNGIIVDEFCRTSDPAIFAAGDCSNHPSLHYGGRVRLESVDNAFEQAKAAALNMLDRGAPYDRVPWFWSDQYDDKLLIVGLPAGHDRLVLRGDPSKRSFSVCYLKDRELLALEAVNRPKDHVAARKLITERVRMDPVRMADDGIALKEAL